MDLNSLKLQPVQHDEFRVYGKDLIVDTCKIGDYYETMVMYPDGSDLECVCNIELDQALAVHRELHDLYRYHGGLLKKVTLSGKYAKLCEAFKAAYAAAKEHKNDDDGGTSNFDRMWLHLNACEELRVAAAAKQAGLLAYKGRFQRVMVYFVEPPFGGQGFRRTNQAEAMCRVMKELGYDAGMYYRMD